ncbi:isocitrate lyase/phosphoenolpyruvate mutase family protein [Arthrobacter sp. NEB 688]|uniref:isocitrate lyase/PEP mutase family protein n=1 Tax=Arthrobacter sp. NEB 688 TaxID=904039 RepID=UPI001567B07B|nr:isocitrate lyase/phosphoenolpyruvate mutase family protein [Arthrobacter sp. NEB 688]QKE82853.1 isocitrate lyase/phosphoenolpyruvate mutase family protein [Arthrobacter sp. NEB 688]
MTDTAARATHLLELHRAPELLTVVNVWDVVSTTVVAGVPGTRAVATASHSIAAMLGYEDGENIPVDEMLAAVERIVRATDLPVTADLESGYGDPAGTVRRAVDLGVVGANLEDGMRPLADSVRAVEAAMGAARDAGVPDFCLNARTDAFVKAEGRSPQECLDVAIERGRAYLEAGAPLVFVPRASERAHVEALVEAFGPQRLTLIGIPGTLPLAELEQLGVARVSYGPWSQRVALTALQQLVEGVHDGRGLPEGTRPLN